MGQMKSTAVSIKIPLCLVENRVVGNGGLGYRVSSQHEPPTR